MGDNRARLHKLMLRWVGLSESCNYFPRGGESGNQGMDFRVDTRFRNNLQTV